MEKSKKKRIVSLVFMSIGIAIVAFLLFVLLTLAVDKYIKKSPVPSFFGTSCLTVVTGSMSGTIEEGDMVIVQKADEYKIGDIITYVPENYTTPVTHRIIQIDGDLFYTKGDANESDDLSPISSDRVVGKVTGRIRYVGLFFTWLVEESGWVYVLAVVLILVAGIVLLKYYSKPKTETQPDKEESKSDKEESKSDEVTGAATENKAAEPVEDKAAEPVEGKDTAPAEDKEN